jgi:hypothetical protein
VYIAGPRHGPDSIGLGRWLRISAALPGFLYAMRRFEIGPALVALGALVLLVSLFLEWYADATAWEALEISDLLLAVAAVAALVAAAGFIAPEVAYLERPWLPASVLAAAVLVVALILSPPPAFDGADLDSGAWIAFASVLVMLVGAILTMGRVSLSLSVEGREPRRRVAAVDHREPTTETGAIVAEPPATGETVAQEEEGTSGRRRGRKS